MSKELTPFAKKRQFPKGGRPALNGIEEPGTRAKVLVEVHGTEKILRAIKDEKYLAANFTTYDAMIIVGIGNALKGSGDERERMFNRMFGKVPDKSINLNLNVEVGPEQLSKRAKDMLNRITGGDDDEN